MPYDSARFRMDASAVDFIDQYSKVCLEVDAIDVSHLGEGSVVRRLLDPLSSIRRTENIRESARGV